MWSSGSYFRRLGEVFLRWKFSFAARRRVVDIRAGRVLPTTVGVADESGWWLLASTRPRGTSARISWPFFAFLRLEKNKPELPLTFINRMFSNLL